MHKIFVVTHLQPQGSLPKDYIYMGVGSKLLDFTHTDKSGDSIAELNPYFCELTAIYWLWKNYHCDSKDVIGLAHYRRFLTGYHFIAQLLKKPLRLSQAKKILENADVIAPLKNPMYPNAYDQYNDSHVGSDLDIALEIAEIRDGVKSGIYLQQMKNMRSGYFFNMWITKKNLWDQYCAWLFPILFTVYERIDLSKRDPYQKRAIGFLAERLFNLWLLNRSHMRIVEVPVCRTNKSGFSNWNRYWKDLRGAQ